MKKTRHIIWLLYILSFANICAQNPPRLTIVFVVDALAQNFLTKLSQNFKRAFAFLDKEGIVFEQANYPHGMPSTAIGHTALNVGTLAHNHGIVGNYWYDRRGEKKSTVTPIRQKTLQGSLRMDLQMREFRVKIF